MRFETRGLGKTFAGVAVLQNIDFEVEGGRCHAIVGANGAGKSTFINVLSGVFDTYDGRVLIDGREVNLETPLAARMHQIGCVHQEFDKVLFRDLSLLENVLLPLHTGKKRRLRRFPAAVDWAEAKTVLARVGLHPTQTEWRRPIQLFRPSFRQKVVIASVLASGARLIIFDEPTSSLGHDDSRNLLSLIGQLKSEGIAIIYISHHLGDVVEIADQVSVFRAGQNVASFTAGEPRLVDKIVRQMLDQEVERLFPEPTERQVGPSILRLTNVYVPMHLRGIDLQVKSGEILGITGLVGAGKSSLVKVLGGQLKPTSGSVYLGSNLIRRFDIADFIRRGVVTVPEDRRNLGLILDDSISQNLSLPNLPLLRRVGLIGRQAEQSFAKAIANQVRLVTYRFDLNVSRLSGGNQQKVVLGKWLAKHPQVLLLDEPTKGIDVGAKMEIYRLLQDLAANGVAVVLVTSEPEEALGVADRLAVMRAGEILAIRATRDWSLDDILLYATGGVIA